MNAIVVGGLRPPPDLSEPAPPRPTRLQVVAWEEAGRSDPRSYYVERFWLPLLGPATTWFLRRVADRLENQPDGYQLDLAETALSLGLGWSEREHSPLRRSLRRCVQFGLARWLDQDTLAVRSRPASRDARPGG